MIALPASRTSGLVPRWRAMRRAVAIALVLVSSITATGANAQGASAPPGKGHWHGGLVLGIPLGAMNLSPEQDKQVGDILAAYRTSSRPVIRQIRQAQVALADKLVVPGQLQSADLQPQLQQISQLRTQLLAMSAQAMLDIRGVLTPEQIATGAQVRIRLGQIRTEMSQLLQPARP
jgi:Spy/CpxP family protein refolding chaperone